MSDLIIETIDVAPRGCGLRQQGGFYMIGSSATAFNSFFPKPLQCACGLEIIRPSRSAQHFFPGRIWPSVTIEGPANRLGITFPADEKAWALTIDVKNYPTPEEFFREAREMGISRRLNNGMPKGFEIGKSHAFIIHSKGMLSQGEDGKDVYKPAFVGVFKPEAIQYVVSGSESAAYLKSLVDKGITLVNVPNARAPKGK